QASVESPVVRIDLMAPRLTADAWVAGRRYEPGSWTAGPVTVSFRCEYLLSGVAYVSPQVVLSTEGRDQTITGECIDVAGNRTTVGLSGINVDRRPPTLECAATPTAMWPPAHRMVPIQIATRGTDALSGGTGIELLSVQSNEPDNGTGDGDTGGDIRDFVVGTFDIAGALR